MTYNKKFFLLFILIIFPSIAIASVTIANNRYSSIMKLPWLWKYDTYDSSNDIWTSNYWDSTRFECKSWSCPWTTTSSWVVFDSRTWLYWQSSSYKLDWSWNGNKWDITTAISYCDNLVQWEYNDWRLPNIKELLTLKDLSWWPNQDKYYYWDFFDLSIFWVFWSSTKSLYNEWHYITWAINNPLSVTWTASSTSTTVNIICVR